MAKINLLPWREELRKQQLQEFAFVTGGVIIIAIMLTFVWKLAREGAVEDQRQRNSYIEQQISLMDEDIKAIEELQKRRDDLVERMNVIQGLQGNRPTIVHVFEQLVTTLPDGIWYTSVKQAGDRYDVEGYAESNNRVSNLMRSLEGSPWFKNPQLKRVAAEGEKFAFSLSVDLEAPQAVVPGADSKGATAADKKTDKK